MFLAKIHPVSSDDYYSAVEKICLTEKAWVGICLTEKAWAGKGFSPFPAQRGSKMMEGTAPLNYDMGSKPCLAAPGKWQRVKEGVRGYGLWSMVYGL